MVFRFKRSVRALSKRKKQIQRSAVSRLPEQFKALARNPEIDLFGEFGKERKAPLWERWSANVKRILANIRARVLTSIKNRQNPPLPAALIVGAVCSSALCVSLAALLCAFMLFGSYGGSYEEVEIPNLIGMSEENAIALNEDIFEYVVEYRRNPDAEVGSVISQRPSPSVVRRLYSKDKKITLTLTVNQDKERAAIPDTVGLSQRDASLALKNAGFDIRVIKEYSSLAPSGTVTYCSRSEGEIVDIAETIILRVSLGKEPVYCEIPDLLGLSESEAVEKLISGGLKAGKISYSPSSYPLGTVIAQELSGGTSVAEGTEISLTVSGGIAFAD